MKIAVASEKDTVAEHFGRCQGFTIFETANRTIVSGEAVPNPGHRRVSRFLHDRESTQLSQAVWVVPRWRFSTKTTSR